MAYNSLRSMSHITSYPSSLKQLDLSHNQITCWPSLPQVEAQDTMEMANVACYSIHTSSIKEKIPNISGNKKMNVLSSNLSCCKIFKERCYSS